MSNLMRLKAARHTFKLQRLCTERICAKSKSQTPATHCTRKSPLPLLPSGPGGVGGSASRGTDA